MRPHIRPRVLQRWMDATAWTLFCAGIAVAIGTWDPFWIVACSLIAIAITLTPVSAS